MKIIIGTLMFLITTSQLYGQLRETPELFPFFNGKKWGFTDENRNIVVKAKFDTVFFAYPKTKFLIGLKNNKAALLDKEGNRLTDFKYDKIEYFSHMRQDFLIVMKNNLYGFIDSVGKEFVPTKYEKVTSFDRENTARFQLNKKWGLVNSKGKILLNPQYESIKDFSANGTAIVNLNNRFFHIDNEGNRIYKQNFGDLGNYISKDINYAIAKSGNKWGVINENGENVIPFEYDRIGYEGLDENNVPLFVCEGEQGSIKVNIHNKQTPYKKDIVYVTQQVDDENNESYDKKNILIQAEKDSVLISLKNAYEFEKRSYKIKNEYDRIEYFEYMSFKDPKDLIFKVYKNGKVGLVDIFGKVIMNVECDTFYSLKNSRIYVFEKNRKKALFDIEKKELLTDFEYTDFNIIRYSPSKYSMLLMYIFAKRKDGFWGYLTVNGDNYFPK